MAAKIKILYVLTKDDVGGAQKYVRDLVDNLDKNKFESKVLTGGLSAGSGQEKIRFLSNSLWPHFFFINDWLALLELFFELRREKPNILHLNNSKAGVIGALAAWFYKLSLKLNPKPSTPYPRIVFTAHGWVFNPDNRLSVLQRKIYILLHRIAARFQHKVINVSEYDRRLAVKHKIAEPEKLMTILNGIDLEKTKFLDKTTARKTLLLLLKPEPHAPYPNDIWIGSIGRLVREKNYETFIETALRISVPNVKFFIIGSGYEKNKLQLLIEKYRLQNKFFLIEKLSPAYPYLKAFDIFLLSSVKEGLPYTLLEAMAAGVPTIVTRVGGMTELVENRGLVMPPRSPDELARAVSFYLQNPEKAASFSRAAKKFLIQELDLAKMTKKTEAAYLG